jgi:hypothetical protein
MNTRIKGEKLIDRWIRIHGEEKAKIMYNEYKQKRAYKLSVQYYIDRFGEIERKS